MPRWMWVALGVAVGGFFAVKAARTYNKNRTSAPTRVNLEDKGQDNTPLQNAMLGLQRSADRGEEAFNQVGQLQNLIAAGNDNDPKYDTEMRNLSPETKNSMMDVYRNTAREKRNDRGTVAFLIGREINRDEDLKFMEEVLTEPPCLSLVQCDSEVKSDAHAEGAAGIETTLIYPQVVSIRALLEFSRSSTDENMKTAAKILLERVSRTHTSERVKAEAAQALSAAFPATN